METPVATADIAECIKSGAPWVDVFELDLGAINGDDWLIPRFWATGFATTDAVAAFEFDGGAIDVARVKRTGVADDSDKVAVAGIGPFTTMLDADGDSDWATGFDFGDNSFDRAFEGFAVDAGSTWFGSWIAEAAIAEQIRDIIFVSRGGFVIGTVTSASTFDAVVDFLKTVHHFAGIHGGNLSAFTAPFTALIRLASVIL